MGVFRNIVTLPKTFALAKNSVLQIAALLKTVALPKRGILLKIIALSKTERT